MGGIDLDEYECPCVAPRDSQGSGAGQIPNPEKVSWIPSLGRLLSPNDLIPSLGRCPRSHLRLIGYCLASTRLASSLDPRLPIGIRPSASFVLSS